MEALLWNQLLTTRNPWRSSTSQSFLSCQRLQSFNYKLHHTELIGGKQMSVNFVHVIVLEFNVGFYFSCVSVAEVSADGVQNEICIRRLERAW